MLRSLILLAAFSFGSTACSSTVEAWSVRSEAILGGEPTSPSAWPSVVWLDVGCSGVLLDETTVVFAAHCGSAASVWVGDAFEVQLGDSIETSAGKLNGRSIEVAHCGLSSRPEPASGLDIAFCRLRESAVARDALPPVLLGCSRQRLAVGSAVTLVGFGFDPENEGYGVKRSAVAHVEQIGSEIVIGDDAHGSCDGDSGSPAFVNLNEGDPSAVVDWRVVGVLSSGAAGTRCGPGRYTDLSAVLSWLEEESRRDFSPCFSDDGEWSASARCRSSSLDHGGSISTPTLHALDDCGAAFDQPPDTSAPRVEGFDLDVYAGAAEPTLDARVQARDVGWGVARVTLELLDAQGTRLGVYDTEHWPALFRGVPLPDQATRARVTALDFAGLTDSLETPLALTESRGCQFAPPTEQADRDSRGACAVLLGLGISRLRRRRSARTAALAALFGAACLVDEEVSHRRDVVAAQEAAASE